MSELDALVEQIPPYIIDRINHAISFGLNKCGVFFRLFGRCKSPISIEKKIEVKGYSNEENYKMQDILGLRIVLYFKDDIPMCEQLISSNFNVINISRDDLSDDIFRPIRLNYVCSIPEDCIMLFPETLWSYPIDKTMEIQVRTIFSEGWHEIEHDLRYKCKSDWDDESDLSRNLNGIFATLETCDNSILSTFNELAYRKYKSKQWESMLRSKFRLRFLSNPMSDDVISLLNENNELAKSIFRVDRDQLILFLADSSIINIPISYNNIIFCINQLFIKNEQLQRMNPEKITEQVDKYILKNETAL